MRFGMKTKKADITSMVLFKLIKDLSLLQK